MLLMRYRRAGDVAARDELIALYMPLAVRLAQRYRSVNEAADDLVQVAALALVKAIDRFDPDRDVSLSSYAVPTIIGELKRYFRDAGWAVRVPRDLQELALRVTRADDAVSRRLGRSPTAAELAAEVGVTIEQIVEAQEAATAYAAVPLDASTPEGDETEPRRRAESTLGREDPGYGRAEQRVLLGSLMTRLDEREREILRLRFNEDLTQSEIGRRLGLSQMHVSRLIRRALARLQAAASAE
jgi:RNA polymerase sigma-B factor